MRDRLKLFLQNMINPIVRFFIAIGITPNVITTIGLLLNVAVAVIFITGAELGDHDDLSYIGWAGATILFAGLFDMLDGQVARLGKMSSTFGALFDSVIDRYSELIMFLGICYYMVSEHYFLSGLIAFIGMIGSIMVSYTRARAEGLGIPCSDGLMQRPERIITIGISAIACGITGYYLNGNKKLSDDFWIFQGFETISVFVLPLALIAILANFTALQRLKACYVFLKNNESKKQA